MSASVSAPPCSKEIRRFKIAVNSACPLRCEYCLLDKDAEEILPAELTARALEFFIGSPGNKKKLLIYGGEPMLEFDRVKDITILAKRLAQDFGKVFSSSIATSGVIAQAEHLEFMAEHEVAMSISIDGSQESHDRFRRYRDGRGSFQKIADNLPLIFRKLDSRAVTALICVHPENAKRLLADFENLISLGFENINIEVVHGFPWSQEALEDFRRHMESIGSFIRAETEAGRFVFLESFATSLLREPLQEKMCPLHSCLEIFPSGDYSFYPFPFVEGLQKRPAVSVGTAEAGLIPRYDACRFDAGAAQCQNCSHDYYNLARMSQGNEPYELRTSSANQWINEIILKAKDDGRFRSYLKEALVRSALGYR